MQGFTLVDKGGLGFQKLSVIQRGKYLAMTTNQLNNKSIASLIIILALKEESVSIETITKW